MTGRIDSARAVREIDRELMGLTDLWPGEGSRADSEKLISYMNKVWSECWKYRDKAPSYIIVPGSWIARRRRFVRRRGRTCLRLRRTIELPGERPMQPQEFGFDRVAAAPPRFHVGPVKRDGNPYWHQFRGPCHGKPGKGPPA